MPPPMQADDVDSPDDFATLCEDIKEGLQEVLDATLIPAGAPVEGEKVPMTKNRRIIDRAGNEFAAKLKSSRHLSVPDDPDSAKVHAFMVGYGGIDTQLPSNTVGCKTYRLRFLVDSYYADDIGTDSDNAEKRHAKEVHMVSYAVFASRTLNRPGAVLRVETLIERRGFAQMGDTMTRESICEIYVVTKPIPLVKP